MEALKKFAAYIQNLDTKQSQKFILITLSAVTICVCGLTYFIQEKKDELITKITQLNKLAEKAARIIVDNKKMTEKEFHLKDILDKNKDFTIKGFFEQFTRDLGITAESGWETRSETINEKFDEVTLPAVFKGQTSESLVKFLETLDKNEMVYLKELSIKKEAQGKITFDVVLATKQYKPLLE